MKQINKPIWQLEALIMESSMIIGAFGLSAEQIYTVETNLPVKNCEIMATDCFSDIVAISEMAIIVISIIL